MRPGVRPDEELLLRLARAGAPRADDQLRIEALVRELPAAVTIEALRRQRLLGLFGRRLDATGELAEAIERTVAITRDLSGVHESVATRVIAGLRGAGIAVVPLKGPWLARRLYGDPGLRPSDDLDLLVPQAALGDAVRITGGLGWITPPATRQLPPLHAALAHPHGLPTVELHWRVHWHDAGYTQAALQRADGEGRLAPTDALVFALLFAARDAFGGLRLTVDAIAELERGGLDLERVVTEVGAAHPELRPALRLAAAQVRSVGWAAGGPRSAVLGLADPLARMPGAQAAADRALLDVLTAPRGARRAALRRQLAAPDMPSGHAPRTVGRWATGSLMRIWRPTRIQVPLP